MKKPIVFIVALGGGAFLGAVDPAAGWQRARAAFDKGEYPEAAARLDKIKDRIDPAVKDYWLYYRARCEGERGRDRAAYTLMNKLVKTYSQSPLRAKAVQYGAWYRLRRERLSLSFWREQSYPKWLRIYLGRRASIELQIAGKLNRAARFDWVLFQRYRLSSSAQIVDLALRKGIKLPLREKDRGDLVSALVKAGRARQAGDYLDALKTRKNGDELVLYWRQEIARRRGKEDYPALARRYLAKKTYQRYRERVLRRLGHYYRRRRHHKRALTSYQTYVDRYRGNGRTAYMISRVHLMQLRLNRGKAARQLLRRLLKKYRAKWYTEVAARNHLRWAFAGKHKKDAYAALAALRRVLGKRKRRGYRRSWALWVARRFDDEALRRRTVAAVLKTERHPFYLKDVLRFMTADEIKRQRRRNRAALSAAAGALKEKKGRAVLDHLNRMIFIDVLRRDEETPLLRRARRLTHAAMTGEKSYRSFYEVLTLKPAAKRKIVADRLRRLVSLKPPYGQNTAVLLSYGDTANAYANFRKLSAKRRHSPRWFITYEHIEEQTRRYGRLVGQTRAIRHYIGFPFERTDLLPRPFLRYAVPRRYEKTVAALCQTHKLDRWLAHAVILEESHYTVRARSSANARGLMQLIPPTARQVNRHRSLRFKPLRLYDATQNLSLGCVHLAALMRQFDGNRALAAAAYNAGAGAAARWLKESGKKTPSPFRLLRHVDYEQTEHYIVKVLASRHRYRRTYGSADKAD